MTKAICPISGRRCQGLSEGDRRPDSLMFRPEKVYHDQTIELITDHAVSIDRAARTVALESGVTLDYGHLVFATGARTACWISPMPISVTCAICARSTKARRCGI